MKIDKLEKYNNKTFEDIKHIDENGNKYWFARELQTVLEYKSWNKFKNLINKAITACINSNYIIDDHFFQTGIIETTRGRFCCCIGKSNFA